MPVVIDVLTASRLVPVRRLAPEEVDRLGFEGPLVLARREMRFLFGPWRPVDAYVVTHHQRGQLLSCTRREIEALGIEP